MKVDCNALAASYSAVSDEDFDVVKREDFTLPARVCYDQEKSRGHPGWHYKPPEQTPNTQRGAVEMAMHYADVIVIDVSEPSDNVIWELQTAAAARPPESILLTGAVKDTTLPELQQALKARLQPVVSNVPLDRCPTFFYPEKAGYFDRYKISWRDLQLPLVGCLRYAPAHDGADLV